MVEALCFVLNAAVISFKCDAHGFFGRSTSCPVATVCDKALLPVLRTVELCELACEMRAAAGESAEQRKEEDRTEIEARIAHTKLMMELEYTTAKERNELELKKLRDDADAHERRLDMEDEERRCKLDEDEARRQEERQKRAKLSESFPKQQLLAMSRIEIEAGIAHKKQMMELEYATAKERSAIELKKLRHDADAHKLRLDMENEDRRRKFDEDETRRQEELQKRIKPAEK
jgi:hypothetical protein